MNREDLFIFRIEDLRFLDVRHKTYDRLNPEESVIRHIKLFHMFLSIYKICLILHLFLNILKIIVYLTYCFKYRLNKFK